MRTTCCRPWCGAVLIALFGGALAGLAQERETAGEAAKEEDQRVNVEHADRMRYDGENKLFFLTGSVVMTHKDITLYCDEAQYNEEADTARATGSLKVTSPESTVGGDLITADFDRKLVVITGNVHLVTQRKPKAAEGQEESPGSPAPQSGGATRSPGPTSGAAATPGTEAASEQGRPERFRDYHEKLTTITCERIDYWYEEKRLIATGNITVVQEDKTVTADDAVYDEENDIVTLTGRPVRLLRENGDEFETPKVTISVEDNWIDADSVRAVMQRKEEKETEGAKEPEGPTTPQPEEPPSSP